LFNNTNKNKFHFNDYNSFDEKKDLLNEPKVIKIKNGHIKNCHQINLCNDVFSKTVGRTAENAYAINNLFNKKKGKIKSIKNLKYKQGKEKDYYKNIIKLKNKPISFNDIIHKERLIFNPNPMKINSGFRTIQNKIQICPLALNSNYDKPLLDTSHSESDESLISPSKFLKTSNLNGFINQHLKSKDKYVKSEFEKRDSSMKNYFIYNSGNNLNKRLINKTENVPIYKGSRDNSMKEYLRNAFEDENAKPVFPILELERKKLNSTTNKGFVEFQKKNLNKFHPIKTSKIIKNNFIAESLNFDQYFSKIYKK